MFIKVQHSVADIVVIFQCGNCFPSGKAKICVKLESMQRKRFVYLSVGLRNVYTLLLLQQCSGVTPSVTVMLEGS